MLNHLIYNASQKGVMALSGRMEPHFIEALSDKYCLFHGRGFWTLIHSKKPELLRAIHCGDAFLTRLEGEWCLRFQGDGICATLLDTVVIRPR